MWITHKRTENIEILLRKNIPDFEYRNISKYEEVIRESGIIFSIVYWRNRTIRICSKEKRGRKRENCRIFNGLFNLQFLHDNHYTWRAQIKKMFCDTLAMKHRNISQGCTGTETSVQFSTLHDIYTRVYWYNTPRVLYG